MPPLLITFLIALLLGIQPVTTDLYLPALPALTQALGASMPQAQLTFSATLLAFGISQLVWGPLSDKYGRRPILLAGLACYTLGSVACFFAPTITSLIMARALQGAAMGASVMCARAMVRDLYAPIDGARAMSKGLTGLGVLACISPVLGGFLTQSFGWRAPLIAIALFGFLLLIIVTVWFQETVTRLNPKALQASNLFATAQTILSNPIFWTFCALSSFSYGALVIYLASSSFIFIQLFAWSKTSYGLALLCNSLFYISGTVMGRRLLVRRGLTQTVAIGACFTLIGGLLIGLLAWCNQLGPYAVIASFFFIMLGHGIHQPFGQATAVGPFPNAAGTASALNGFVMMLIGFLSLRWLGFAMDGTILPLAGATLVWAVLIALVAFTAVQQYGPKR